ncbi:MAG: hypothetical protein Q8N55_02645 [bacterium]|nr:hypothetical protein [bacterium]
MRILKDLKPGFIYLRGKEAPVYVHPDGTQEEAIPNQEGKWYFPSLVEDSNSGS